MLRFLGCYDRGVLCLLMLVGLPALLGSPGCKKSGSSELVPPAEKSGDPKDSSSGASSPPSESPDRRIAQSLAAGDWNPEAAKAVIGINRDWFAIQAEENPAGLDRQITLLKSLGKFRQLDTVLQKHPELAGLLAAAADPISMATTLESTGNDYAITASLYVSHASPNDAAELATALKLNRDLICQLQRRGLIGSEVLFVFERDNPAADEYEKWLQEVMATRLSSSDEELASMLNLALTFGPEIRKKLRENDDFRRRFRSELWPRLENIVKAPQKDASGNDLPNSFENYLLDDRIWDLLMLPDGDRLVSTWGPLPIDLLYGYEKLGLAPPYPKDVHDCIIEILLKGDLRTLQALLNPTLRTSPRFHEFLKRHLPSDARTAAVTRLLAAGSNAPSELEKFSRLSDSALVEEVGPPPGGIKTWIPFYYTVYEVPKKLLQGRDPTGMDWFCAITDPAFLVIDLCSGGGAEVGKEILTKGGRTVMKKGAGGLWVTTLRRTGLEIPARHLGEKVVEEAGEKQLARWTVTGTLTHMQEAVHGAIGRATTFDITKPVQFFFQHSGVGRKTFKSLTGLEARLVMRGDAHVYIHLTHLATSVLGIVTPLSRPSGIAR